MEAKNGGLVQMMFLFNLGDFFRFQPLIFRAVCELIF